MFRAEIMGLGLLASASMIFKQRLEVCGNLGSSIPGRGKDLQWGSPPQVEQEKEMKAGKTGVCFLTPPPAQLPSPFQTP